MSLFYPSRILLLGMVLVLATPLVQAQDARLDVARRYARDHAARLALTDRDTDALALRSHHVSATSGATHYYFQQEIDGVPVYNAIVGITVGRDGEVVHATSRAVPELARKAPHAAPALMAEQAAEAAARAVGLEPTEPIRALAQKAGAPSEWLRLSRGGVASDDITAQLMYVPTLTGDVRLGWVVNLEEPSGRHYWHLGIDAVTGDVLFQHDLVVEDNFGTPPAPGLSLAADAEPAMVPRAAGWSIRSTQAASGSYRVYPEPLESPSHAGDPTADLRTLVSHPADPTASPLGWHNDGTTAYTVTRGNNAHAYTDTDADNIPDVGSDPDGGAGLVFDFPLDLTAEPDTYRPAAVTNLFYWNNHVHDVMYHYGFTEAAGNFQTDNFGNGGLGDDYVQAEAQDGSGTNNANFGTPVDGSRPRMQMFRWSAPAVVSVNQPSPIAGDYNAGTAAFGPPLTAAGLTGDVELGDDGAGDSSTDACEPLVGFTAGHIALVDRGACSFVTKVRNAQNAGAIAVIVANNVAGGTITMGDDGTGGDIVIPSAMISLDDGALFKANLPLNATLRKAAVDRDSDFDNGVIVHEYGHGISHRLTGGPNTVSCLFNYLVNGQVDGEQMGEGWSDYFALLLTDTNTEERGIGTYLIFEPTTGGGIRPYPYTTNMAVNPSTYATVQNPAISVPHGVGSVWATMLWEMTQDLVAKYGFDPDIYGDGGNNQALQLVTEGLKLQACNPGFVDGRDAILAADVALNAGGNQCTIWDAFARRGLGYSADQGFNFTRFDGTEAFDLPVSCSTFAMLNDQVAALLADGTLSPREGKLLSRTLQRAERKADGGKDAQAIGFLNTFIGQVNDFVADGTLTQEQADNLIAHAEGVIARIEQNTGALFTESEAPALASVTTELPTTFGLGQNYPNPFNGQTEMSFALPEDAHVQLSVYDVLGREVARLVDAEVPAGTHQMSWDASAVASGTYILRMTAGSFVETRRMTVAR